MKNQELLLVPGPTPVVDEIYDALASETRGHTDPRFVATFKRAIDNTKKLFQTDGEVYCSRFRHARNGNGSCKYSGTWRAFTRY